ncbi:MAG: nicotinamide mononucleotide transporter [Gammaproteobacteria bacterium]|nr:nicotinamide mononucleotide transporter [Gammaproteobacteria bacterium]
MLVFIADYFGAILALTITILYARNNILAWPLCITSNLISLYLYYTTGIYGEAALEIVYIILAIYGLAHWAWGGPNNKPAVINQLPFSETIYLTLFFIFGYVLVFYILTNHTNSTIPALDAITMVLSIIGQWLTSRRYIESWIAWFITDSIMILMFYYKGLNGHLILNFLYLFIAIYGYRKWNELRNSAMSSSSSKKTFELAAN